jgi:dipeptidyl aminopeptidase/acylaminoacyl peptidase
VFASNRSGSFDLGEKGPAGNRRLTHTPAADRTPAWSPDGTTIAFVRAQPHHADIWLLNVGTGVATQLTHDNAHDANPSWFEDSSALAYDSDRSGQREIWVADASDGTSTEVDTGSGNNTDPSVRTGDNLLAFVSDRTGSPAIWTMQYPSGTLRQLTDGSGADHTPTWSPYGELITFSRGAGSGARLYQMGPLGQNQIPLTFGPGADGDPSSTVRDKAADDQTKDNLEQAIADANVIYAQDGSYAGATNERLSGIDSSLVWQTSTSTGPDVMSWSEGLGFNGPNQAFAVAAQSPSGPCFLIKDIKDWPGGEVLLYGYTFTPANCTGIYARANASAIGWGY